MVADINEDGGKRTTHAMPNSMKFHKTNVTKESDWKTLVDATNDAFGSINCLINNAGTTYRNKGCLDVQERMRAAQLMLVAAYPRGHGERLR